MNQKSKSYWLNILLVMIMIFSMPFIPGCGCNNEDLETGKTLINITYPAGRSPNVFTSGWVFGAKCVANAGTENAQDASDSVQWSGSGTFEPEVGAVTHPTFDSAGENYITATYKAGGKTYEKTVRVQAVSPEEYAHVGTYAFCPADVHGCPSCPHAVTGQVKTGSPNVTINGQPAAREGDTGIHALCCGPNTFVISEGDPDVLINGKPAARLGDATTHCGGVGKLVAYAPAKNGSDNWDEDHWIDLGKKLDDPDTSLAEKQAIKEQWRAEKLRLEVCQDSYEHQIPMNWRSFEPGSDDYKKLQETRKNIQKYEDRLIALDKAFK